MEAIAAWFTKIILAYLLTKATNEAIALKAQTEKDAAKGVVNAANTKAYEEATDRAARRKAALDLLNRNHPS